MKEIKTPAQEKAAREKILHYQKVIALDIILQKRIESRVKLLLWIPFSGLRRIRLILELESINSRIISRQKFLDMYSSRVDNNKVNHVIEN